MVSDFIEEHGIQLSDEEYKSAKDSHPGLWKEARQLGLNTKATGTVKNSSIKITDIISKRITQSCGFD